MNRKILGYPAHVFIALAVVQVIYLLAVAGYNALLLDTTVYTGLNQGLVKYIRNRGEFLSASGIALLFAWLIFRISAETFMRVVAIRSVLLLLVFLLGLQFSKWWMDVLVEEFEPHADRASFVALAHYGLVRGIFEHSDIMPARQNNEKPEFTVSDRVMLSNLGLLLFVQPDFEGMLEKGYDVLVARELNQRVATDFPHHEQKLLQVAKELNNRYTQVIKKLEQANKERALLTGKEKQAEAFNAVQKEVENKYADYSKKTDALNAAVSGEYDKAAKDLNNSIESGIKNHEEKAAKTEQQIRETIADLSSPDVQRLSTAEYQQRMIKLFGHEVAALDWCRVKGMWGYTTDNKQCYNRSAVELTVRENMIKRFERETGVSYNKEKAKTDITRQAHAKWDKETGGAPIDNKERALPYFRKNAEERFMKETDGIPSGLSMNAFAFHSTVLRQVIEKLHNEGITVPVSWRYEPEPFARAYLANVDKEIQSRVLTQMRADGFESIITSRREFFDSKPAQDAVSSGMAEFKVTVDTLNDLLRLIRDGRTKAFRDEIYIPLTKARIEENFKATFGYGTQLAEKYGRAFLPALAIPPVSIALTLLFGILNLLSLLALLIGAIVSFLPVSQNRPWLARLAWGTSLTAFAAVFWIMVFQVGKNSDYYQNFPLLNELRNHPDPAIRKYHAVFGWVLESEDFIYAIGKNTRNVFYPGGSEVK